MQTACETGGGAAAASGLRAAYHCADRLAKRASASGNLSA
jgi:hypothetical protein